MGVKRRSPLSTHALGLAFAIATLGCTGTISSSSTQGAGSGGTTTSVVPGAAGAGPAAGGASGATAPSVPVPPASLPQSMSGPINPGRVVAHRLNKVEYDNTIRDLIGLDLAPSSTFGLPDDTYVEGFDNNADALSASPLLLEKYQAATAAIVAA